MTLNHGQVRLVIEHGLHDALPVAERQGYLAEEALPLCWGVTHWRLHSCFELRGSVGRLARGVTVYSRHLVRPPAPCTFRYDKPANI